MVEVSTLGSFRVKCCILQLLRHTYTGLFERNKKTTLFYNIRQNAFHLACCVAHSEPRCLYPIGAKLPLRPGDFSPPCNLSPAHILRLGGKLSVFSSLNSECGKWVAALSLCPWQKKGMGRVGALVGDRGRRGCSHKTWNAQEGSRRSEAILTHRLPSLPSSFVSCSFSFW